MSRRLHRATGDQRLDRPGGCHHRHAVSVEERLAEDKRSQNPLQGHGSCGSSDQTPVLAESRDQECLLDQVLIIPCSVSAAVEWSARMQIL